MNEESTLATSVDTNAPVARQRKKRKWDQPAEAVISGGASTAGLIPVGGIGLPGIFPSLVGVLPTATNAAATSQMGSALPYVQQNAVAIVQKINQDLVSKGLVPQTKIQDELIAREIVINDAESGVRYKLTKRQTQEEVLAKTGAVVITRGKYKPPNGPVDHEKPLYLHISAGAHLKDTAERIRAVDQAAALVDEMLKQGRGSSSAQLPSGADTPLLSTVVFVDFETNPLPNLINRIRGPNDQYINHIMNETGATVILKGGSCDNSCNEELPQPLHLFISADHPKNLDDAKRLAENLLETIHSEFVGSRPPYFPPAVSYNLQQPVPQQVTTVEPGGVHTYPSMQPSYLLVSGAQPPVAVATSQSLPTAISAVNMLIGSKSYSAVPPPQQLSGEALGKNGITLEASQPDELKPDGAVVTHAGNTMLSLPYPIAVGPNFPQQSYGIYPQASQGSQSHSAYTGLYPQASPLQQVALALQRPPSVASIRPSLKPEEHTKSQNKATGEQVEKQEKQRRKFREMPVLGNEAVVDQVRLSKREDDVRPLDLVTSRQKIMPPPTPTNMPPPPPRIKTSMGPPPPPLSATRSTQSISAISTSCTGMPPPSQPVCVTTEDSSKIAVVPTKGLKLVEYGEDDDDSEVGDVEGRSMPSLYANGKPFWAA